MLITPKQIKAARAFLLWSQEQLAEEANVSVGTVIKAEDLRSDSRGPLPKQIEFASDGSLKKIKHAFEAKNIEFVGTSSVTLHEESPAKAYSGYDGPDVFFEHLLLAAKKHGKEILVFCDTIDAFMHALGADTPKNISRIEELSKYAKIKCLLLNDDEPISVPFDIEVRITQRFPFAYQARVICEEFHATIETIDSGCFAYYELPSSRAVLGGQMEFATAWVAAPPIARAKALKKARA